MQKEINHLCGGVLQAWLDRWFDRGCLQQNCFHGTAIKCFHCYHQQFPTVFNSVFITTIIIGSRLQAWMTIRGWGLWWQKTGFHSAGWQRWHQWQRWQHLWLWSEASWCQIRKSSSSISRRHYHCLSTTIVIIWVQHHTASCLWFEKIGTNVQTIWRRSQVLQSKAANDVKQTKKVPF